MRVLILRGEALGMVLIDIGWYRRNRVCPKP